MRPLALRIARLVLLSGLVVAAFAWLAERMIFQPTAGIDLDPDALGISAESLFLETEDGVRVHAFFLPAGGEAGRGGRALLFLHGNAGNASHRLPNAAALAALGADVLLLDYRGYGLSEGRPSEAGLYADARAGLAHLVGERDLPEQRIALFGRSLGGAVAVDLARGRPLAGVILESTFTSLPELAGALFFRPLAHLVPDRFDSAAKIGELRAPLLFFHGDRDDIVPLALGQSLFERAPEPKTFELLRGAGHNDTVQIGGRAYFERIRAFLDEVAPPA